MLRRHVGALAGVPVALPVDRHDGCRGGSPPRPLSIMPQQQISDECIDGRAPVCRARASLAGSGIPHSTFNAVVGSGARYVHTSAAAEESFDDVKLVEMARQLSQHTGPKATNKQVRGVLRSLSLTGGSSFVPLLYLPHRVSDENDEDAHVGGILPHYGAGGGVCGVTFRYNDCWYGVFRPLSKGQEALRGSSTQHEVVERCKPLDLSTEKEEMFANGSFLVKFKSEYAVDEEDALLFRSFYKLMKMPPEYTSLHVELRAYLEAKCKDRNVPGLPPHWGHAWPRVADALRPIPCSLRPNDAMLPEPVHWDMQSEPFIFDGVPGSGKTVGAIMLPEDRIRGRDWEQWDADTSAATNTSAVICGIYTNDYGLLRCPRITVEDVAVFIAQEIKAALSRPEENAWDTSLANIIFYIVMDELGSYPLITRLVTNDKGMLIATVRDELSLTGGYTDVDACSFVFSVVGTGVTAPSTTER